MVRPVSLWSFTQPENITPQALSPLTGPHCVTDKSMWGLHVATFSKHQWDEFSVTCRVEQFLWIRILHKWLDWLIKIHLIILMCKSWRVKISSSNYFTSDQRAKQWRYSHSDITSSGTEKELLLYVIDRVVPWYQKRKESGWKFTSNETCRGSEILKVLAGELKAQREQWQQQFFWCQRVCYIQTHAYFSR